MSPLQSEGPDRRNRERRRYKRTTPERRDGHADEAKPEPVDERQIPLFDAPSEPDEQAEPDEGTE